MSHLLDEEGNVYEQGLFGGWHRKQGLFGPEKDVGWFGQPNVERDFFGNPVPESTFFSIAQQVLQDIGDGGLSGRHYLNCKPWGNRPIAFSSMGRAGQNQRESNTARIEGELATMRLVAC